MSEKNKKIMKIVFSAIAGVFLIAYVGYQFFLINNEPVKTEVALEKTVYDTVDTTAFFVRDESYIENNSTGTLVPLVTDGMRVANGDTVAVVFKDEQSARDYKRISELNLSIAYYLSLKNRVGVQTTDLSSIESRINSACRSYIAATADGDIDNINGERDALKEAITARQLATGSLITVDEKLASLNAELAALKSKSVGYNSVIAGNPGYYISSVDGFETTVTYKDAPSYTIDKINQAISSQPTVKNGVMGKLVDSFNWYILCTIDAAKVTSFSSNRTIKVLLPNASVQEVSVSLLNINDTKDGKTAIVLKGNTMDENIANLRLEDAKLVIKEYTGYRIDNKAIRIVDGKQGVFVIVGNIVKFRKINIIYSADDFSIVKNTENESGHLKLYDEVIVEGTDLYDGKIVS